MARQNWFERVSAGLAVVSIGLVVSGTRACQEDYDLGSQANLNETPTATPTDEGDDGGDDDLTTPTPNGTGTPNIDATETPEPADPTPTVAASLSGALGDAATGAGVLQELQSLSEKDSPSTSGSGSAAGRSAKSSNWLGDNFGKGGDEKTDPCMDSDGDGFTDSFEDNAATDPNDAGSTPPAPDRNLMARLKGLDTDGDGLSDNEDPNPNNVDTDLDGRPDGAEVLSGGNPREPGETYPDDDGDGLSNSFEENRGSDSQSKDTDGDGLDDAEEQALGANPTVCDTDGDGVLDGPEVKLFGSDPTRGAARKKLG